MVMKVMMMVVMMMVVMETDRSCHGWLLTMLIASNTTHCSSPLVRSGSLERTGRTIRGV